MNTLLDNLRYTVRSTFDIYSTYGKKIYSSSLVGMIWITIASGFVATAFVFLMGHLLGIPDVVGLGTRDYPLWLLLSKQEFLGLNQATIILFLGLYGTALVRGREENEAVRPSLQWYTSRVTRSEWKITGGCFFPPYSFSYASFCQSPQSE